MSKSQIIYSYEGPVDLQSSDELFEQVKNELDIQNIRKVYKKRMYNFMVECIQNILRHNRVGDTSKPHPHIKLEREGFEYRIISTNPVYTSQIGQLRTKLNKLAESNKEQLSKMYEKQINADRDYSRIGAGLGLIIMSLKSSIPLQYEFVELNEEISIYKLQATVTVENV